MFLNWYGIIMVQQETQDIVKYFLKNTKSCGKVADIQFENNKKVRVVFSKKWKIINFLLIKIHQGGESYDYKNS